ncbi:hypothetical protein FB567DRAFT_93626 [Paraphoma chrysanthemicola]|uniref:Uncharacterized protein n=1 Tax=Paraphoma chrysanthemicola TaxID=798071 RepID=A0A8K0R152_9PLEO|nr:hypothetical protein FB567DRAFT_93626 [Paraphoma chrysanthemicola]
MRSRMHFAQDMELLEPLHLAIADFVSLSKFKGNDRVRQGRRQLRSIILLEGPLVVGISIPLVLGFCLGLAVEGQVSSLVASAGADDLSVIAQKASQRSVDNSFAHPSTNVSFGGQDQYYIDKSTKDARSNQQSTNRGCGRGSLSKVTVPTARPLALERIRPRESLAVVVFPAIVNKPRILPHLPHNHSVRAATPRSTRP